VIPTVPGFCNYRFERCKFIVRHDECAEEMLFEQWSAGERKEQRGRECLAPQGLALWERWFMMGDRVWIVLQLVRQDLLVLTIGIHPIVHLFHTGHDLVAHIQAKFPHLPLLNELPVFSLSLPGSSTHAIASRSFLGVQNFA